MNLDYFSMLDSKISLPLDNIAYKVHISILLYQLREKLSVGVILLKVNKVHP